MLNQKDNEAVTRVSAGTPMGDLVRRFWVPFLQSWEVPEPDCDPIRVTLMGEELVAFRDTNGKVGLVGRLCLHRNADLFFGRNEDCGLRCTYHGWKYDTEGNCIDMPSEDDDSIFKDKIQLKSYPVNEAAGVLWTYMGPKELTPDMPKLEWMRVDDGYRHVSWNIQQSNFVQAIEGGIDSAHVNYLHSSLDTHAWIKRKTEAPPARNGGGNGSGDGERARGNGGGPQQLMGQFMSRDKHPKLFVKPTDYGLLIGARRHTGEENDYWRLNNFLMPFYTTPPGRSMHAFVPLDDTHTARWSFTWQVDAPYSAADKANMRKGQGIHSELIPGTHTPTHNMTNDYKIDRTMQRLETFTGIKDFGAQDYSIQEGMGAISDRTTEHLGITDRGIIAMRALLLESARNLLEGIEPPHATKGDSYWVHGGQTLLPATANWEEEEAVTKAIAAVV